MEKSLQVSQVMENLYASGVRKRREYTEIWWIIPEKEVTIIAKDISVIANALKNEFPDEEITVLTPQRLLLQFSEEKNS